MATSYTYQHAYRIDDNGVILAEDGSFPPEEQSPVAIQESPDSVSDNPNVLVDVDPDNFLATVTRELFPGGRS